MSRYLAMENFIDRQLKFWEQQKEKIDLEPKHAKPFITISREYGCSGYEIAKKIIEKLNMSDSFDPVWAAYDKQVLNRVMEDMGLTSGLTKTLTDHARQTLTNLINTTFSNFPPQVAVYRKLAETIRTLALNGHVVLVGRASNVITRGLESGYHIRIIAPMDYKIEAIKNSKGLNMKEAEKLIIKNTETRVNYIKEFVNFDVTDSHNYHLVINLGKSSLDESADIIIAGLKAKGLL